MKNLIQYISVGLLGLITFACSNNFLSNTPDASALTATSEILISESLGTRDYSINVPTAGNANFSIVKKPDWLDVQNLSGQFSNNVAIINCSALNYSSYSEIGIYKSSMVLNVEGYGNTTVPVSYVVEGNPSIEIEDSLFFQSTTSDYNNFSASLAIRNTGAGILLWSIAEKPDWISISFPQGISDPANNYVFAIPQNGEFTVNLSCTAQSLDSQDMTGEITIKSNAKNNPSYTIAVKVNNNYVEPPAPTTDVEPVEGTVIDAQMDKAANILYLVTSQPDRLLAYNTDTKSMDKELSLDLAPTCFRISESGHNAIIGHDGMISYVDLDNFSVIKTIAVDHTLSNIEWGANNWCCYTWEQEDYYNLHWLNLDTEESYETSSNYALLFGKVGIKKIPNQDYVVASILSNSPSRMFIYDSQTRDLSHYFSQDIGNFWFSSDGNYLFTSKNEIYETASLYSSSSSPYLVGEFSPKLDSIYGIDHSSDAHAVWILCNSADDDSQREIRQYDDYFFSYDNTYNYDTNYEDYPAQAQYIFADNAGSKLFVIKSNSLNDWAIENIPVTK